MAKVYQAGGAPPGGFPGAPGGFPGGQQAPQGTSGPSVDEVD